jgi:2-polyprenyl-3-methyl-5-hydroxy-6-metoxy-1,4-benzoquinol methylase
MFGSEYANHINILRTSFGEMKDEYKKKIKKDQFRLIDFLQKIYIRIFGIPEVGFQIRGMYFKNTLQKYSLKPKNILDAGCGIGAYSFYLAKNFPKVKIDGEELDKNKINFCKTFARELDLKNLNFFYGNLTKENTRRKKNYDLIINIDVLEHVKEYKKTLKTFYNSLKKGGYLYIHVPQPNQERIFKSLKKWEHEDHAHEGFKIIKFNKELKGMGFKIIDLRETFGFFGKLAWELNHILLAKSFVTAAAFYPFLFLIAKLDLFVENKKGLGFLLLAQKI